MSQQTVVSNENSVLGVVNKMWKVIVVSVVVGVVVGVVVTVSVLVTAGVVGKVGHNGGLFGISETHAQMNMSHCTEMQDQPGSQFTMSTQPLSMPNAMNQLMAEGRIAGMQMNEMILS